MRLRGIRNRLPLAVAGFESIIAGNNVGGSFDVVCPCVCAWPMRHRGRCPLRSLVTSALGTDLTIICLYRKCKWRHCSVYSLRPRRKMQSFKFIFSSACVVFGCYWRYYCLQWTHDKCCHVWWFCFVGTDLHLSIANRNSVSQKAIVELVTNCFVGRRFKRDLYCLMTLLASCFSYYIISC